LPAVPTWALEVVKGYQLELVQATFQIGPVLSKAEEQWAMQAEIQVLQGKQAIVDEWISSPAERRVTTPCNT